MSPNHPSQILSVLTQVCSAFFEKLDRQTLISRILDTAIDLTQGERGTVFLSPDSRGQASQHLTSLIATGLGGKELRVSVDQGVVGHVFRTNLPMVINDAHADPRFYSKIDESTGYMTRSILCVPLRTATAKTLGAIEILNSKRGKFQEEDLQMLQVLSLFAAIALEQRETIDLLTETNEKLNHIQWNWMEEMESSALKTRNPVLQEIYEKLPAFAISDSSILIEGESGTGKEMIAQLIHFRSKRKDRPFVAVNCAAIPESLFEAELFGVARGAATGTIARKGKIELAHGGTLFLDEIGELPLSAQAKLLRALQDKAITRVGSEEKPKAVDFRVVAATNRDLGAMVKAGTFREDLFYRIHVVRLHLLPLRERIDDLPDLCQTILSSFSKKRAWKPKGLSQDALSRLMSYSWPGNIRELQNKLESAIILSGDRRVLEERDFQLSGEHAERAPSLPSNVIDLDLRRAKERVERDLIEKALHETHGNKSEAARKLGITREGLRKAMLKLVA